MAHRNESLVYTNSDMSERSSEESSSEEETTKKTKQNKPTKTRAPTKPLPKIIIKPPTKKVPSNKPIEESDLDSFMSKPITVDFAKIVAKDKSSSKKPVTKSSKVILRPLPIGSVTETIY